MEDKFCEEVSEITKEYFNGLTREFVPKSKQNYLLVINEICNFCKKDFLDITREDFKDYLEALREAVLKNYYKRQTANRRISTIKSLSDYIANRDCDYKSIVENYDKYSEEPFVRINNIPTWKELDELLSKVREQSDNMYLLCVVIAKMGISIDKALSLRYCDLIKDVDGNIVGVNIKGQHHKSGKSVPLPEDIKEMLSNNLSERLEINQFSYIFHGKKRNKPLSPRMAEIYLKKIQEEAGFKKTFRFKDIKARGILALTSTECSTEELEEFSGLNKRTIEKYRKVANAPCPADLTNIRYVVNYGTQSE